ncbi:hypothetical protein [Caulobacter sp. FWC2]|uniref:hypothetical protein n=1 Tax=Caulobacter sp. FWC2 TaxID=69664 RepID=UPI000C14A491|nr:hypothetical protein [Caulobacter sp. FWC2]PIB91000.1 hypothetical protein CSW62_05090 [Caulobacter sp. FWC2]
MAVELTTEGLDANSFIASLEEANLFLLEVYDPELNDANGPAQLNATHIPQLIEAAHAISTYWSFLGHKTHPLQNLAWPRTNVTLGRQKPGPGWFNRAYPHLDTSYADLAHHVMWEAPGLLAEATLPNDEIPRNVKVAQAILAALFTKGVTIWEDNKGDNTQVQIDTLKVDQVNAVSRIMSVRQRLAPWGKFIGSHMSAPGGARG